MNNAIIILGSSRSDGNTKLMIHQFDPSNQITRVDLNDFHITPFDYDHKNQNDDYLTLMEKVLTYEHIILATPVYWYTMSAQMKIFIDRLSDLITIKKDMGRQLRGKKLAVLASYSTSLPPDFETPFIHTCGYLSVTYMGCFFHYSGNDETFLQKNNWITEFKKNLF